MSDLLGQIYDVLCEIRRELVSARLERMKDLCTEEEAAQLLGCSARKVRDLRAKGVIRGFKVGHDRRYSRKNILEHVESTG